MKTPGWWRRRFDVARDFFPRRPISRAGADAVIPCESASLPRAALVPPIVNGEPRPKVSILIPARNEERVIVATVEAALASQGIEVEVIVLDDNSDDATAELVGALAARDRRLRLLSAPQLPLGWCGKQHACHVLAQSARHDLLLFLDADAQLAPDGAARLVGFLEQSQAALVSGIPHEETGTLIEKMVLPLIHFILLGFLPISRMRRSVEPAYAAGCGQLFLTRRDAYEKAGGHVAISSSLHDGLKLPHAYRAAGLMTDLCDATDLARCRMYRGFGELWRGLSKNATEGMAQPALILPFTILLLGGQVMPVLTLLFAVIEGNPWACALSAIATVLLYYPRIKGIALFRQSAVGALLHPLGVLILLAIQWYALSCKLMGRPVGWKGRQYRSQRLDARLATRD